MNETALTEREVALRLAVSPFTLRAWRRQGRGPAYMKLGKAVRYRPHDVAIYETTARIAPKNEHRNSADVPTPELTPE